MSQTTKVVVAVLIALIVLGICVVVVLLAGTLNAPESAPTPTSEGVDDSWDRIQAAGKIVVGTSADYPPFEYFADGSRIDGFDIALMDEIGRRLGVPVEYRNYAFDGLGSALQLDQIDVAIAAISVTAEREAVIDFSNVYFVGEDGVLASEGSDITDIRSVEGMTRRKVGVQRNTVHEDWVQSNLVDPGEMPADNLYVYENAEDAVRDLQQQRVDLVLMDAEPAEAFAQAGGVRLVGRGLNQQRFALALPKGASSLKAKIDGALTELHNEGVVAQLAKRYLDLDQLLPTPTPAPTSTPGPSPACVDGLTLVEHLSYDDQSMTDLPEMKPGQPFTKGWRVKNAGTCTWDSSYHFVYANGNDPAARMGGQSAAVQGQVAPGARYDLEIDLVAPLKPGSYEAFWQMENGSGQAFGERLGVGVQVPAAPTATPAPTQTPAPGTSFTVDRTNIKAGECIVFSWQVENVNAVYFYAEGERWQDHGRAGEGRQQECPPVTTTYNLRVVKPDNAVDVRQISIYVESAPDVPQITRFTVDPPNQVAMGQCVDIRWLVEGDAEEITIRSNDVALWQDAPLRGTLQDCPPGPATVAYGIEAVGPGGTSRQQKNVNVVEAATATPMPTSDPSLPAIYSFSVNPNQVEAGDCVGISWSVGGGTSVLTISRNNVVVVEGTDFDGQQMDCLDDTGSYVYRLEAFNLGGNSVAEERTASVTSTPADNPLAGTSWSARAYYDGATMTPVLEGTNLTADFGGAGDLHGSAGCNTYSASYLVDGRSLTIPPPALSGMVCSEPEGIMEQETAFLEALGSVARFSIEANELYFQNASNEVVLEFIRQDQ